MAVTTTNHGAEGFAPLKAPASSSWLLGRRLGRLVTGEGCEQQCLGGCSFSQIKALTESFKELNLTEQMSINCMPWQTRGFPRDFNSAHKQLWCLWRTVALVTQVISDRFFFSWFEMWRKKKILCSSSKSLICLWRRKQRNMRGISFKKML